MHLETTVPLLLFCLLLIGLTPLLGRYMAYIFADIKARSKVEDFLYRLAGIHQLKEMDWWTYGKSLLYFNLFGFFFLFLLQLLQGILPLNPQQFPGVPWPLAFNTAASFVTNTNWQAYTGEATLSYLTQMLGLTVQNFLSAATGLGAFLALTRGLARNSSATIGCFWSDLVKSLLYLFLPLSIIFSLVLVSQGTIQNFSEYKAVKTVEGASQSIPMGPVASQIAIKQLGTNGGGFFNANSAHPFENPTGLANFLETLALVLIPAALTYTYGLMIGSTRQGWLLFGVMFVLWGLGLGISFWSELSMDPVLAAAPLMEGKEARFGIGDSLLWSTVTTATANGSVNAMHSSLSPLAGGIALFNIMLGELLFGGIGVGMSSMLMFVLLTVFLAGLMVGRTPEYLGKKIKTREIQWVMMAVLTPAASILIGAGLSSIYPDALASLGNAGPHGLTEILYAFTSTAGNNGSAFAGLNANTNYYNLFLGAVMLICRVAIILPSLALAGRLGAQRTCPVSNGTFSTNSLLFIVLLCSVIVIVGALTFFPALTLGPIVEQMLMRQGRSF